MFKRAAVLLLLLVLVFTSVSCGKKDTEPEKTPAQTELEEMAGNFVARLVAEDYSGAVGFYDGTMKTALPENKLKETWEALLAQVGPYKNELGKRVEEIQGYNAVFVTTQLEKAKINIRVVFNGNKEVAGLFFEPAQ